MSPQAKKALWALPVLVAIAVVVTFVPRDRPTQIKVMYDGRVSKVNVAGEVLAEQPDGAGLLVGQSLALRPGNYPVFWRTPGLRHRAVLTVGEGDGSLLLRERAPYVEATGSATVSELETLPL